MRGWGRRARRSGAVGNAEGAKDWNQGAVTVIAGGLGIKIEIWDRGEDRRIDVRWAREDRDAKGARARVVGKNTVRGRHFEDRSKYVMAVWKYSSLYESTEEEDGVGSIRWSWMFADVVRSGARNQLREDRRCGMIEGDDPNGTMVAGTKVRKVEAEELGNSMNDERRVESLRDSSVGRMKVRWAE